MSSLSEIDIRKRGPRRNRRRGQAAVEMMIAVIGSMLLIVGSLRIWLWMVTTLVERQEAYEATRRRAGRNIFAGCPNGYYTPGRLSVFGEADIQGQASRCQ